MQPEAVACHSAVEFVAWRYTICTLWLASIKEETMPRGDKSKYTEKEKRQAEHIEEGYEKRGAPKDEAERRAWATVNAVHGGGEKPGGGGYGKPENHEPMRKGGRTSHKGGAH
jgi:plasmid stabilization system protein ParE